MARRRPTRDVAVHKDKLYDLFSDLSGVNGPHWLDQYGFEYDVVIRVVESGYVIVTLPAETVDAMLTRVAFDTWKEKYRE